VYGQVTTDNADYAKQTITREWLRELLCTHRDRAFLVLERHPSEEHRYVQVAWDTPNKFIVECRNGNDQSHYQTTMTDVDQVVDMMLAWFERREWRGSHTWTQPFINPELH
jgi:hypothetical protein